ncbi:MAG: (d)CMP kinase [Gammaproteobacteria bacterium]|nr:(d)CMP kinase [Gammaproteobacteria bacterium]
MNSTNNTTTAPVITIDGPTASGKGTITRLLAGRLGWRLLDSGALYRLVALAAERRGITLDDLASLEPLAAHLDVEFVAGEPDEEMAIVLEGEDVTSDIRTETCGNGASRVAALPVVRAALLERQRAFAQPPGLVADGRDMGTVVFPRAAVKIFLTASAEERARRRYNQLKDKGLGVTMRSLLAEIAERDTRDQQRSVSPLAPAEDAVMLDSSDLSIDEVVEHIWTLCQVRLY